MVCFTIPSGGKHDMFPPGFPPKGDLPWPGSSEVCCVSAHQPGRHRQDVEWHSGGLRRWVVPNSEAQFFLWSQREDPTTATFFLESSRGFPRGSGSFLVLVLFSMVGNVWGLKECTQLVGRFTDLRVSCHTTGR